MKASDIVRQVALLVCFHIFFLEQDRERKFWNIYLNIYIYIIFIHSFHYSSNEGTSTYIKLGLLSYYLRSSQIWSWVCFHLWMLVHLPGRSLPTDRRWLLKSWRRPSSNDKAHLPKHNDGHQDHRMILEQLKCRRCLKSVVIWIWDVF